ncbi:hypothetical protein QP185_18265 [Sphingomonas aerolata]|uniref:hypothetical protein n=1 Tax=Sphingomonas aerolata TaxID=185951 RepID=UPI002FE37298
MTIAQTATVAIGAGIRRMVVSIPTSWGVVAGDPLIALPSAATVWLLGARCRGRFGHLALDRHHRTGAGDRRQLLDPLSHRAASTPDPTGDIDGNYSTAGSLDLAERRSV